MRTLARTVKRVVDVWTALIDVVLGCIQAVAEQTVEGASSPNVTTGILGLVAMEVASHSRRVRTPGTAPTNATGNDTIDKIAGLPRGRKDATSIPICRIGVGIGLRNRKLAQDGTLPQIDATQSIGTAAER